jgi:hypothetical protein
MVTSAPLSEAIARELDASGALVNSDVFAVFIKCVNEIIDRF